MNNIDHLLNFNFFFFEENIKLKIFPKYEAIAFFFSALVLLFKVSLIFYFSSEILKLFLSS